MNYLIREHFQEMKDKVQCTQSSKKTSEARTENRLETKLYSGTSFKHRFEISSNNAVLFINFLLATIERIAIRFIYYAAFVKNLQTPRRGLGHCGFEIMWCKILIQKGKEK